MKNITRRNFLRVLAAGSATAALAATSANLAFAEPTSDEVQAEADAVEAELAEYQEQLDIASDKYFQAMAEHDAAVAAMEEAQARIDAANEKLAILQRHLSIRAREMYKNGTVSFVDVLLGAESFEDFSTTWDFLQEMNTQDSDTIIETEAVRAEAQAAHDEYAAQEQIAADKLAEAEQIKEEAEALVAQTQARLDSLNEQVRELREREEAERQAAAARAVGYTGGLAAPPDANTIVAAAYSQLGVPYVWGGTSPGVGLDCSGLVWYCYSCAGINLPRWSQDQRRAGAQIPVSQAAPGDILGNSHHVAIYIGNGAFIHAPYTGTVVQISTNLGQFDTATRIG